MVIVDLNALEIGSELLLERNREIQSGMESRAVLAVFAFPGVRSCESCLDLSARKVNGKLRDSSFWCANPGMIQTCKVSMTVSETNNMSHDVIFPWCDEGVFELPVEIVPHDARTTGEKRKIGLASSLSELGDIGCMTITIANSECVSCPKRKTMSPAGGVHARSLVAGDKSGSRDVGYPIPKVGLLEE